jgi:hypothetical protein
MSSADEQPKEDLMQFRCKVIGHELVRKQDEQWLKVKLKGTYDPAKVEILVPVSDRAAYPLGSPAILDFSVRQTDIDLEDNIPREARKRRKAADGPLDQAYEAEQVEIR